MRISKIAKHVSENSWPPAGAICYLPTDGTNVPDFLLAEGTARPDVQVCYGIVCSSATPQPLFSSMIRFKRRKSSAPAAFPLLLESCLDLADAQQVGIVMIAESAGLVGAALRRSPVKANAENNAFQFPEIREWLSFTAERAHTKSVVLVVGIAVRGNAEALDASNSTISKPVGFSAVWPLPCCRAFFSIVLCKEGKLT